MISQVAQIIGEVTKKEVKHVRISMDTLRENLSAILPSVVVETLIGMEEEFANNVEAIPDNGEVERLTGQKPIRFREWAEKNKAAWI
jgi:hypothetical protein